MDKLENACWIGIDVAKDSFEVCFGSDGKSKGYANSPNGISRLIGAVKQIANPWLVIESSGGYEQNLLISAWKAGIKLSYVNPRQTEAFRRSLGTEAKTDKIDARAIALFGERLKPRATEMPSEDLLALRALLSRRHQLVYLLSTEKNHKAAPTQTDFTLGSFSSILTAIKAEIKKIDAEIAQRIENSAELSAKADVIRQNKGAGPQLTAQLIANMPELGILNRKKITALAGLAPFNRDSGAHSGVRAISGGRREVRNILYMATVAALRCNQQLKVFFLRLVSNGKTKMKALIATMRHFLCIINAQMREFLSRNKLALSS